MALNKPHPSLTLDQAQQEVSQMVTIQKHRECNYGAPILPPSKRPFCADVLGSAGTSSEVGELDRPAMCQNLHLQGTGAL